MIFVLLGWTVYTNKNLMPQTLNGKQQKNRKHFWSNILFHTCTNSYQSHLLGYKIVVRPNKLLLTSSIFNTRSFLLRFLFLIYQFCLPFGALNLTNFSMSMLSLCILWHPICSMMCFLFPLSLYITKKIQPPKRFIYFRFLFSSFISANVKKLLLFPFLLIFTIKLFYYIFLKSNTKLLNVQSQSVGDEQWEIIDTEKKISSKSRIGVWFTWKV